MKQKGILFVLSAPSGCGKTTVLTELLKKEPSLKRSVTYTTRSPRVGEVNGVDYHFLTKEDFAKKRESGFFLEHANVYENCYGTSREDVERMLERGEDVLLSVDVQGARTVRGKMTAVLIFLMPPSIEALQERLLGRGTETPEVLERRLGEAKEEMTQASFYDYTVTNDKVEKAVFNILTIIQIERNKRS